MNILQKVATAVLLMTVVCLYSCESCLECTINYVDAQTNKDTSIVRVQCSKKKDREEFKNDTRDRAIEKNGTFDCIIKED